MNSKKNTSALTLLQLQTQIKEGVQKLFSSTYQIIAEINEIKENASGHCYLELVQHNEESAVPLAKASATIWSYTYRMLKPYFINETGRALEAGMKILVSVQVKYHEVYGLSFNIVDIDPAYTVGEIELQRQRTIKRLVDDGIFDMNKSLEMPILPLRIAVISSSTAAGYRDFMNQLYRNGHNYNFSVSLFAAAMQGKEAEQSIIDAINQINGQIDNFDVLAIIRGGGSISDLSCFDGYELACNIAQMPIPVITGIGHDKDVSVADMVANTMQKTPTAAAEFLVNCIEEQDYNINELSQRLADSAQNHLQQMDYELQSIGEKFKSATKTKLERGKIYIDIFIKQRLKPLLTAKFKETNMKLDLYGKSVENHNPQRVLQRGYSVVTLNGKTIKNANTLHTNDNIEIIFSQGRKKAKIDD